MIRERERERESETYTCLQLRNQTSKHVYTVLIRFHVTQFYGHVIATYYIMMYRSRRSSQQQELSKIANPKTLNQSLKT